MELKDFVKLTLEQIVEGVAEAQASVSARGGVINPGNMNYHQEGKWNSFDHAMPQQVNFDVGLTSTGKAGSSEGIGVFLGSINLGKRNDSSSENVAVTRVQFTVPLVLPAGGDLVKRNQPVAF